VDEVVETLIEPEHCQRLQRAFITLKCWHVLSQRDKLRRNGFRGQRRNEVKWRPEQETCLVPPCSNLGSFGSKFTVLKKILVTFLVLFGARGIVPPLTTPHKSWGKKHINVRFWSIVVQFRGGEPI